MSALNSACSPCVIAAADLGPGAQLKEIKNGRLAMLAFGGIFHQQLLTKTGSLAFLANPKVQF